MDILEKAKLIQKNGGRLYLVGGAVRDEFLGIQNTDKDYCITGLTEEDVFNIFPETIKIGKDFPVFLIDNEEFALARKERKTSIGHTGFEIISRKEISIEEDLMRRDVTINSIAKDILTGNIIDPFNGQKDLKDRILRHISPAFSEDPLRVYRVARFAAKLNFKVANETIILMNSLKNELSSISEERVFVELNKALNTNTPSLFFNTLKKADCLDVHFKEIYNLIDVPQPLNYHPEGDVYNHTMIVLDEVSKHTTNTSTRFAALVHDLGKALTPKEQLPHHIDHDINGVELVSNMCNRLKLPNIFKKKGREACKYHMRAGNCLKMRPYKLAVFFNVLNKTAIGIDDMQILTLADDMLHRPNTYFADIAHKMLDTINGETLKNEGITFLSLGKEKYLDTLYTRQANFLKTLYIKEK